MVIWMAIDWAAVASFSNAAAVLFAALVANRAFRSWQIEWIAKRQSEIAETALSLAYEAEHIFASIRSPWQFIGPDESVEDAQNSTWRNYRKRLDSYSEYFQRVISSLPTARAVLGEPTYTQIRVILEVRNEILISLELIDHYKRVSLPGEKLTAEERVAKREHEAVLWGRFNENDATHQKLVGARKSLEAALLPMLRLRRP